MLEFSCSSNGTDHWDRLDISFEIHWNSSPEFSSHDSDTSCSTFGNDLSGNNHVAGGGGCLSMPMGR